MEKKDFCDKKNKTMEEQRKVENVNTGHVHTDVSTSHISLQLIQQSLASIHVRLDKLDTVEQCIRDMKQEIWGSEGLDEKIGYVAQQSQDCYEDVIDLKEENVKLRKDVELLKGVVIKLDRKVTEQNKEILNLKGRSMRDNILIHNFVENKGENLMLSVPAAIKQHLNVDVEFVRIHRNSPTLRKDGKPRTITGKLVNLEKKAEILKAQKEKRDARTELPFNITPQSPTEIVERRKQLFEINKSYHEQNIKTRVVGEKLLFPDNSQYRNKVSTPKAEDILTQDQKETEKLNKISLTTSDTVVEAGNRFIGNAAKVGSLNDVRKVYKKVVTTPGHTDAHHNILVYRYVDSAGNIQKGYQDDGEFGAGRKLLKFLETNDIANAAFVITRWFSGNHIGPKRFSLMEKIVEKLVLNM